MFAVPGWSVSAKSLVTQKEPRKSIRKDSDSAKAAKKRKRSSQALRVTDQNLADLWRKHIEEKGPAPEAERNPDEQPKKKRKKKGGEYGDNGEEVVDGTGGSGGEVVQDVKGLHQDEEDAKGKTHTKKKKQYGSSETLQQPGGDIPITLGTPPKTEPRKDGKALYEQRKALALEKRSRKSFEQASGSAPPLPQPFSDPKPTQKAPSKSVSNTAQLKDQKKPPATTNPTDILPPSATKLTHLQLSMKQKLISARFRHLNQTLYTTPSSHASALFSESPANYTAYHAGFRAQVAVWPQNPVDAFITDIKTRAQVGGKHLGSQKKRWREQKRGKNLDAAAKKDEQPGGEKLDPLPRSPRGMCTIADLGCGDATLAGALTPFCKQYSLRIQSFDLAKGDGPHVHLITVADVYGKLPLVDGSVDVAIFCLALMGTNWVDGVKEAVRIVRSGGEVWISEIKSRFVRPLAKKENKGLIGRKPARREEEGQDLVDVEDEKATKGDETDVGPFVAVCQKRGLFLKGEPDLSNKMFARMRFVKVSGPRVRRDVEETQMPKFIDKGDEEEGKVLKPCVYKTR